MCMKDENSRTHPLTIKDNLIIFQNLIFICPLMINLNVFKYIHCLIWNNYGNEVFCINIRIFILIIYTILSARLLPSSVL